MTLWKLTAVNWLTVNKKYLPISFCKVLSLCNSVSHSHRTLTYLERCPGHTLVHLAQSPGNSLYKYYCTQFAKTKSHHKEADFFFRLRPYGDHHGLRHREGNYNPNVKRRDAQGYAERPPFNWRESRGRGRGRPRGIKRMPLMGELREPRFNHSRSPSHDSFHTYPPKMDSYDHQRRPSSSRPNRPPRGQHHSSSRSPRPGSPGRRGPPFPGQHQGHRPSSPRHFPNHPADRRPSSSQEYRGSFRGHRRQSRFPHHEQQSQDHRRSYSPRERPFDHSGQGTKRWNEGGGFSSPNNGEHRPPRSNRSPREMNERGSCPERYMSGETIPAG